jgi:hypothetical protein
MKSLARAQDKAEILQRLSTIRSDSSRRWGRMSAHQMICHLNDSFLAVTGGKAVSIASGPFRRTVLKWVALYLPVPWPQDVPTMPEIDQTLGGTKPVEFARDLKQLEALVEVVTTQKGCFDGYQHPYFGPLSERAWMRWAYLHMDHHLRQFGS